MEHDKAEKPGNFGAIAVAERSGIERQHVLIFLTQAAELKYSFFGTVNVLDRSADAFPKRIGIAYLRDFARCLGRDGVVQRPGIQQKQFVRHVADFGRDEQIMPEPEYASKRLHFRCDVAILRSR